MPLKKYVISITVEMIPLIHEGSPLDIAPDDDVTNVHKLH